MSSTLLLLTLLAAAPTESPEATFKSAIEDFEFGEHAAAAAKLRKILEPPRLESREDLIVARQYLGACYHLLDEKEKAKAQFSLLLALDPKHKIDPEVFSPAVVAFFEEVRREAGLDGGEGGKKVGRGKERPPEDPAVKEPAPGEEPDAAKKAAKGELPKVVAGPPPLALAFFPLGVGQLANRHYVKGALFGVAEVGLFTTAAVTYAMFEGLKVSGPECLGADSCFRAQDRDQATTLQTTYLTTFWVGAGVAVLGIVEALISYPGDAGAASPASAGPARAAGDLTLTPTGLAVAL